MATITSQFARVSRYQVLILVLQLAAYLISSVPLRAETIIRGKVVDQTTLSGIVGASVRISRGGNTVGEAVTAQGGQFSAAFDPGASLGVQTIAVMVEHQEFEKGSVRATVTAGTLDKENYEIALLPRGLSGCLLQGEHGVVVGYFGPNDLARDVTYALTYSLVTRIQMSRSLNGFRPPIRACNEANPRSLTEWGVYAKALSADVLLGGNAEVKAGTQRYDVNIRISDRFSLFNPPREVVNQNVNLKQAEAAQLEPRTHALILTAIAKGFELEGQYTKCVDIVGVAERILNGPSGETKVIRQACEAKVPNRGLLRDRSP